MKIIIQIILFILLITTIYTQQKTLRQQEPFFSATMSMPQINDSLTLEELNNADCVAINGTAVLTNDGKDYTVLFKGSKVQIEHLFFSINDSIEKRETNGIILINNNKRIFISNSIKNIKDIHTKEFFKTIRYGTSQPSDKILWFMTLIRRNLICLNLLMLIINISSLIKSTKKICKQNN